MVSYLHVPEALEDELDKQLSTWEEEYHLPKGTREMYGWRFEQIVQAIYTETGRGAVVLIDEYDKPLLDVLEM